MKKIVLDLPLLRELIEVQQLQQWRVAQILGVSRDTILRACRDHGLLTQRTGPRNGDKHPGWKGGVKMLSGYRYLYRPDHPNSTKQGFVAEHRLVMERTLGRLLERHEVVHHLNDDRVDNRPENLSLFPDNAEHLRQTIRGQVPKWSEEGKERMVQGGKKSASLRQSGAYVLQRSRTNGRYLPTRGKASRGAS